MEIPSRELAIFRATDREQCGVVVKKEDGELRVVEVPNVSQNPEDFAIRQSDVDAISLAAGEVIFGLLHTHLPHHSPYPSDLDFHGAHSQLWNYVYHPVTGSLVWHLTEEALKT
jgi:proteasome lid subunit RPN8/RPN11